MFVEQMTTVEYRGEHYDASHGSPFDRGSADSYYGRPAVPHRGGVGGGSGPRIESKDMTLAELRAYFNGYEYNERFGDKKEY